MAVTINASTTSGLVMTSDLSGNITLQNNGSNAVSLASGGVTLNTSNAGITFNNSSALVNSNLNDYETGTWTPVLSAGFTGIGTPTLTGTYVKIGKLVFCDFVLNYTTSLAGTSAQMTGVPFTPSTTGSGAFANNGTGFPVGSIGAFASGIYLGTFSAQAGGVAGSFTYKATF